jgi:hypothetical protein
LILEKNHKYGYLKLELPKSYNTIDLKEFIDDNNPQNKDQVMIINKKIQPSIKTGDLSSFAKVKLVNYSEIQGLASFKHAFTATSDIILDNHGAIRAAGGNGGHGGNGANDTFTTHIDTKKYELGCGSGYSWADHDDTDTVTLAWPGIGPSSHTDWMNVSTTGTGPITSPDLAGEFYRGAYKQHHTCDVGAKFYEIIRRMYFTQTRAGGKGGKGGIGRAFDNSDLDGEPGYDSTPKGGNKGGDGGAGGDWGRWGHKGADGQDNPGSGQTGSEPGWAIDGDSHVIWRRPGIIDGAKS